MIKYEESRADRDHLRDTLRRHGKDTVDQVAQAIRERWHHGHLRSYRLAVDLSLPQVCAKVNDLQGAELGDAGYLDPSNLSKFEHWPHGARGRRPSAGYLIALAQVYGTNPRSLIAEVDWDKLPSLERLTLQAVDRAPVAPTPARGIMDGARPPAGNAPQDPPNWWAAPEPIGSGNPIERAITMANDESARYADRASNVGPAIVDALREDTADHARRFPSANRLELFASVRLLRDRIFTCLDGGQPISQRRELYFLAAAACGMLADVSDQFGYSSAAMSQARVAHVFASEAGDPVLTAWLYTRQATFCYWNGQPGKAREYARRGAALHPMGTVGVFLASIEARAAGALQDSEAARAAVRRAAEVRQVVQPSTLDGFGGFMYYSQAKQHFYATGAYLGVGDDTAAISEANAAIDRYETGPADEYHAVDAAIVRLQAAAAHVRSGNLDAAAELAQSGLGIEPAHRNSHVESAARRLHHQLGATGVQAAPLAVETRDQIEEFLSLSPARLELS